MIADRLHHVRFAMWKRVLRRKQVYQLQISSIPSWILNHASRIMNCRQTPDHILPSKTLHADQTVEGGGLKAGELKIGRGYRGYRGSHHSVRGMYYRDK